MLTEATKQDIYELYLDKSYTVQSIADLYKLPRSTVHRIAVGLGAPARRPRKNPVVKNTTCYKCKSTISVANAKFCPYCGSDIRTVEDKLIARIQEAMQKTIRLPESDRDSMQALFIDLQSYLKEASENGDTVRHKK